MKKLILLCACLCLCGYVQAEQSSYSIKKGITSWLTGPVGPQGERGEKGETGEKVDQGEERPKDSRGSAETSFVSAYGFTTFEIEGGACEISSGIVPFRKPSEKVLSNVDWDGELCRFIVRKSGVYEVNFYLHCQETIKGTSSSDLVISIVTGSEPFTYQQFIPSFHTTTQSAENSDSETHGTTFVKLSSGDFVYLELQKKNPESPNILQWREGGIAGYLSLKRLSN